MALKVLIFGASGFIGRSVIRELMSRDLDILSISRKSLGLGGNVIEAQADFSDLSIVRKKICDFRPDVCIDLVWYAEPGKYLSDVLNIMYLEKTIELIRFMGEIGCAVFFGAGTCAEYDYKIDTLLHEESSCNPQTLYAASKLSVYHVGIQLARQYEMAFNWGRVFHLYGPNEDRRRLFSGAISSLLSAGEFNATEGLQIRDFLHVADVGSAICEIALCGQDLGAVNICSSEPRSIRDILGEICLAVGEGSHVNYGTRQGNIWDPPFVAGDNTKLKSIGWSPRIMLRAGIEDMVRELRKC